MVKFTLFLWCAMNLEGTHELHDHRKRKCSGVLSDINSSIDNCSGLLKCRTKTKHASKKMFLISKGLGYFKNMFSFLINHSVLFTETFDIIRIIIRNIRNIWLIECGPYQSSPMSRAKTHNQIFILVVRLAITYLPSHHSHLCS